MWQLLSGKRPIFCWPVMNKAKNVLSYGTLLVYGGAGWQAHLLL
jgi:hypothetical protein